jgi:hypothetical protein
MRCLSLSLLALLLSVPVLHAQTVEIYGTATGLHATNVPVNAQGIPENPPANPLTSLHTLGAGGGVTINFLSAGPFKLGFDARGSTHLAMGGAKLSTKVPYFHVRPYVQGSIGYLNLLHNNIDNKYTVAEFLAGVDIPIFRQLDLRAVEFGVGHALGVVNNSKPTFITAATGLVFHF